MAVLTALLSLFGCRRATPAPTVAELKFPVLLVTENVSLKACPAEEDLTRLHSNYLDLSQGERRFVIDSDFRICQVLNLRSTRSPYLRMLTGPGTVAVQFEMEETAGGLEAARKMVLGCKYLSIDSDKADQARQAIAQATSVSEMLVALEAAK